VGKSSLLNLVLGSTERTAELSRGERGRQTTTTARWFAFGTDGAIVDSPGFQAFGLDHVAPGELAPAMDDLAGAPGMCRFADCLHREEPGCRIRAALEQGTIDPARYAFYRELLAHLRAHEQVLRTTPKRG
jgi:ribosome biogenesis GTPase